MKRNRAAFTIVQNEPVFLSKWLDYYGRYFPLSDLYVLDHATTDGSTGAAAKAWPDVRFVPVHRLESFNHNWLRETVEVFQRFLLQSYDNVLFAEADEFVVADPTRYDGLGQYIERLDMPIVRCVGLNVYQTPEDAPLDFAKPWLPQRTHAYSAVLYSKPILSKLPLKWMMGFHSLEGALPPPQDSNLSLFHCHRIDYDYCLRRHESAAKRNWSRGDLAMGLGAQNRIIEPIAFRAWYYGGSDLGEMSVPIPDVLKVF
jgi:hypothetical protein